MKKRLELIRFKGGKVSGSDPDGKIIERGTIGTEPNDLNWEVYSFGTIHITDGKMRFKKDCDLFEQSLDKVPLDLKPGDRHVIKASGDNDDLIVENIGGEYRLSLTRRGIAVVERLRELIDKARKTKNK